MSGPSRLLASCFFDERAVTKPDIIPVLNRLIVMHGRSLPNYLTDAVPWISQRTEAAALTLQAIASDQRITVDRIAEYVQRLEGSVIPGTFPMHFANWNDLSIDFLVARTAEELASQVVAMEALLPTVASDPTASALLEEALGAAKGHLDTLAELTVTAS